MNIDSIEAGKLGSARDVSDQLQHLEVSPHREFVDFYELHEGPFSSMHTGYELADLVRTDFVDGSIMLSTLGLREALDFPNRFLVISNLLAHACLIYDSEANKVFNVDFEGTHIELLEGTLEPEFLSFSSFITWYFHPGEHND